MPWERLLTMWWDITPALVAMGVSHPERDAPWRSWMMQFTP
ncbi:hypothetical protein [Sanguibacter sp. Z1732]